MKTMNITCKQNH